MPKKYKSKHIDQTDEDPNCVTILFDARKPEQESAIQEVMELLNNGYYLLSAAGDKPIVYILKKIEVNGVEESE